MRFVRGLIGFGGFVSALFAGAARGQTAGDAGAPTSAAADAGAGEVKPSAPTRPATGYGYGEPKREAPAREGRPVKARAAKAPPPGVNVATLPGFEVLPDGGSRLFVQLTGNPQVDEKKAAGSITYVIKGARILRRNNRNALETAHFNTPVLRARLVPSGHDLHFVVDLRQNVAPKWQLTANSTSSAKPENAAVSANGPRPEKANEAQGGATMMLAIDFPKGDFLPAQVNVPPPPGAPKTKGTTPTPPPRGPELEPLPETVPEGEPSSRGSGPDF
jgi:hypothetical protein